MNILLTFTLLSIVNVVLSTAKSIVTIKGGKLAASMANALYYGFYNIVIVWTVIEFPMWQKCLITFACNLVGVFIVKAIEEKADKVKLWKIEMTIPTIASDEVDRLLEHIPHSMIKISDKHTLFSFYCATKAETEEVRECGVSYHAKFFAAENKL